jgi:hypothetical protein
MSAKASLFGSSLYANPADPPGPTLAAPLTGGPSRLPLARGASAGGDASPDSDVRGADAGPAPPPAPPSDEGEASSRPPPAPPPALAPAGARGPSSRSVAK